MLQMIETHRKRIGGLYHESVAALLGWQIDGQDPIATVFGDSRTFHLLASPVFVCSNFQSQTRRVGSHGNAL